MTEGPEDDLFATGGGIALRDALDEHREVDLVGRRLGDYSITGLIAAGGMSRVYRAKRVDGKFEREVAVKVSPNAGVSAEMRRRFTIEQGVLAGLNHPNISQLYDAGITDEGWPYIVMELIDGTPVSDYCEQGGLSLEERLRLMVHIADAVAFAHARLVVHRDIKPSNVLVASDGRPRLLDFGIAKLIESDSAHTRMVPLTPRYASPEQLLRQSISTASDVYQLGVLLYEMLCGQIPAGDESMTDAIKRAAEQRSRKLSGESGLPQEIVHVIEKCLRADPDERYRDVNQFRDDLQAFIDGFPVTAHGQSVGYRFRKLVSRNRPAALISAAALVAVAVGIVAYTTNLTTARDEAEAQAVAAELAAQRAQQTSEFFARLLTEAAPQQARGVDITVSEVIDRGIDLARSELSEDDTLRGTVLATIAHIRNETGKQAEALSLIDEAIGIFEQVSPPNHVEYAKALYLRGIIHWYAGRFDESRAGILSAIDTAERLDEDRRKYWHSQMLNMVGMVASTQNDFDAAIGFHRRALSIRRDLYGEDHWETVASLMNIGSVHWKQGKYAEALPSFEVAYQSARESLPKNDPRISRPAMWLGRTYILEGRLDDAAEPLREAVRIEGMVWGEQHTNYAGALYNLAKLAEAEQDYPRMAEIFEESLDIQTSVFEPGHYEIGLLNYQLALAYAPLGRIDEAIVLVDQAVADLTAYFPDGHRFVAYAHDAAAVVYALAGEPESAIEHGLESVKRFAETVGEHHASSIRPAFTVAKMALLVDRLDLAAEMFEYGFAAIEANERGVPDWRAYTDAWLSHLATTGNQAQFDAAVQRLAAAATRICAEVRHPVCE